MKEVAHETGLHIYELPTTEEPRLFFELEVDPPAVTSLDREGVKRVRLALDRWLGPEEGVIYVRKNGDDVRIYRATGDGGAGLVGEAIAKTEDNAPIPERRLAIIEEMHRGWNAQDKTKEQIDRAFGLGGEIPDLIAEIRRLRVQIEGQPDVQRLREENARLRNIRDEYDEIKRALAPLIDERIEEALERRRERR